MSAEEENRALIRRYLEAHAKGDLAAVEETLAPNFVNHNPLPGQKPNREGYFTYLPAVSGAPIRW